MADVQEYAARLAQNIGPRPAGTEEEQQASFAIEEVLQQEAALKVQSEEFNCNSNYEMPRIVCCIITLILAILSIVLPLLVVPSFVVCLITAVLFALEVLGLSPLSRTSKRGVSQNVIGKYVPALTGDQAATARRRKVVIVAHYDTGRVRRELAGPIFGALSAIHWIEFGAMILVPFVLLIKALTDAEGTLLIFLNVLTALGAVGVALAVISFIMHQSAAYNEGANCNAAGVAVMLEVAKRVGRGLYEQEEEIVVHGEEAAREILPDEVELEYAVASPAATNSMEPLDLSAEIAAAQAARGRSEEIPTSASAQVMPMPAARSEAVASATATQEVPKPVSATVPSAPAAPVAQPVAAKQEDDVPDWYRRAREKANRSATDSVPVQRSRFAEAMEAAQAAREAEAARAAEEQQGQVSEVERRLAAMRASIMGETAEAAPAAAVSTQHAAGGVDGFLSQTTEAPDYETASAADDAATSGSHSETKQAADVADRIISHVPATRTAAPAVEEATEAEPTLKPAAAAKKPQAHRTEARKRRSIDLPSLTGALEAVHVESEDQEEAEPVLVEAEVRQTRKEALSASIPSLDGVPRASHASREVDVEVRESVSVSQAGSFAIGGATGAFDPVGEELLADVDPDDIYIDDADDSDYEDNFTEAGTISGPGYVNMPTSRKSRVFGRFRRNKHEDEQSFSEVFGLEEDFDARKVGKARGGWESFRNQSDSFDDGWDDEDDWNGGAFSKERLSAAMQRVKPGDGSRRRRGSADHHDFEDAEEPQTRFSGTEMDESAAESDQAHGRNLHPFADIPLSGLAEEREAVHDFHSGPINVEIWFVALGAELADNAGIKALIAEHAAELRGAMIIDLEALGAGELSLIQTEGMYRTTKNSSRLKRYVRKAAESLGLTVGKGNMLWCDSAAYCAARKGYQTLHLAGLQNGRPAHCGQADDVFDNLSADIMQDNADFLMELIRAI